MLEKETFSAAMKGAATASKILNGKVTAEDYESAFSRNMLELDLGNLKDSINFDYSLDDATRDRLIAHGRQDGALVYAALVQTRKELRGLRNIVWLLGAINLILLVTLVLK